MLNRLRRRFVTISMIIISCVLVFFFMLFCSVFVVSLSLDMRTVLGTYSENPTLADLPEIGGRDGLLFSREMYVLLRLWI